MKKHIVSITTFAFAFFILANVSYAEQKGTSLDAHVHGLSQLNIAVEGEKVELEFSSPAMNLVGFEHKATSKKDIAAVKQTESILRQPEMLFSLSEAQCKPVYTNIDISGLIEHDHKAHDEHETHSEIVANYSFECKDSSVLSSIKVSLFESFAGIYKIQAMWVTPSKQGSAKLTAENPVVLLR